MKCNQCSGAIGTNNETAFPVVTMSGFYLNTAAPAPCRGTITSWRYCYYKPETPSNVNDTHRFVSRFAVYRPAHSSNGSTSYTRISNRSISLLWKQIPNDNRAFICKTAPVRGSNIDVEAGDVFGVCIYNPARIDRHQLDFIGQANGYSLVQTNRANCWRNTVTFQQTPEVMEARILHLYANIKSIIIIISIFIIHK